MPTKTAPKKPKAVKTSTTHVEFAPQPVLPAKRPWYSTRPGFIVALLVAVVIFYLVVK